jgi:hypothetical protein
MRYNARKRQALGVFRERGWLNPPAWALLAGFYPARAAYSYLGRLWRWGLLRREQDSRGLVIYGLSEKGLQRLVWLEGKVRCSPSRATESSRIRRT